MTKRAISNADLDILHDLQEHYSNKEIKIDYDIMGEPAIFYNWFGSWNIVYKLSQNGAYMGKRWDYVSNAHAAIKSFRQEMLNKANEDERKYQEEVLKMRNKFSKGEFKDDLPQ
jgi:hypothetical protein